MPLSTRPRLSIVLVAVVLGVLAVPGCADGPEDAGSSDGWQQVALPDGMVPSTLHAQGDEVLVGGHHRTGTGRTPALARMRTGGPEEGPAAVALTPATPYGKVADLVAVAGSQHTIIALGAARGGAHANARWTIWTGTATAGVVDRPQSFETFGGQQAGGLLGVAVDGRGPLVLGTWQGRHGLDGAVWRAESERWVRQPTAPVLANTVGRQVAPRTVSQQLDGSVIVNGSVIDLADGVRQAAARWRDTDGSWDLTVLPDVGARSEAWSTACAERCWTIGSREGSLAVWSPSSRADVPDVPVGDQDTGLVALYDDVVIAVVSSNGHGRLLVGHGRSWRLSPAPDGTVRAAALIGTRIFLVSGDDDSPALSVRDLTAVLDR